MSSTQTNALTGLLLKGLFGLGLAFVFVGLAFTEARSVSDVRPVPAMVFGVFSVAFTFTGVIACSAFQLIREQANRIEQLEKRVAELSAARPVSEV